MPAARRWNSHSEYAGSRARALPFAVAPRLIGNAAACAWFCGPPDSGFSTGNFDESEVARPVLKRMVMKHPHPFVASPGVAVQFGATGRAVRFAIGIALIAIAVPASASSFFEALLQRAAAPPPDLWWVLLLGLIAGALVSWRLRNSVFVHAWVHEATHAVVAALLLVKVDFFVAKPDGSGQIQHASSGNLRNAIISLAPYSFPLVLGPMLLVREILRPGLPVAIASFLSAGAVVFHLAFLWRNLRVNFPRPGSDIAKTGRVASTGVIAVSLIWVLRWSMEALWR